MTIPPRSAPLALLLLLAAGPLAAAEFAGGSGTEGDPYQVATLEQFLAMQDDEAHYLLVADIDARATAALPAGAPPVYGLSIDGGDHAVRGLTVRSLGLNVCMVYAMTVRNLRLVDVDITGHDFVGSIMGWTDAGVVIEYCHVTGVLRGTGVSLNDSAKAEKHVSLFLPPPYWYWSARFSQRRRLATVVSAWVAAAREVLIQARAAAGSWQTFLPGDSTVAFTAANSATSAPARRSRWRLVAAVGLRSATEASASSRRQSASRSTR